MPRCPPTYAEFFFDPLTEDVEELLGRFQHRDSVRYEVFSSIWREMGFSDVFFGIPSMNEMKRFCRVTLATAVKYFLPPYSFQIRVGGLYLMFGFYHTQLAIPPLKIRLALKDWSDVQKFLKESVASGHYDVVYIYQKLVFSKAFHYTAMPHLLSFQKQRKKKKNEVCAGFLGRTTAIQELLSAEIFDEMANIQNHYEKMKTTSEEVKAKQISMTHQDFVTGLKDCMSAFISWQQKTFSQDDNKDKNSDEDEDEEKAAGAQCSSRARLLSSIKQKSYSQFQEASRSRRHRQPEAMEDASSGPEQVQKAANMQSRKPSLRARTHKNLRVTQDKKRINNWLLTAPELGGSVRR
ncbi:snRNA-activating protein complex subunit 1-like [Sphaeramia orbicularis]|uniref:snRNA-activating protein complex subunit 1-like n=1 Tax=Sphaeramia orbicularis TaxID=375764 RepID=A0A673A7T2_9TELE|nr:snRNA-activating protein complex subunit 1-like [Sphaeramia orbicularis]